MLDYVRVWNSERAYAFSPLNVSFSRLYWAPNSTNEFKLPIVFRELEPLASIRKHGNIFIIARRPPLAWALLAAAAAPAPTIARGFIASFICLHGGEYLYWGISGKAAKGKCRKR